MNTNITKAWTIEIREAEVFARCTNESLYQAYNRIDENPKGDALVIQDDDRGQFRVYFDNAIAGLNMMLARRMGDPCYSHNCNEGGKTVIFNLFMHDNHDDAVLPVLISNCYDYMVKKVLEQWYHADYGSELSRLEVLHCLHYRKYPVRRRIGPLF